MSRANHRRQERGIALLLTIFGLLLLTAVAAAMMFSSDTETSIAVNYRDKQSATYAALSGLQEVRDRLHPIYGDLSGFGALSRTLALGPGPNQLATLSNGQVLYIINPNTNLGETAANIAPWDPKLDASGNVTNPFFDTELCQEQYTGSASTLKLVTNAPGKPCTVIPTKTCTLAVGSTVGSGWCTYYDNSANATGWNLQDASGNPIPLDYKWVRVTLKADNSGIVYVQTPGSSANGTQVCWDTRYDQQVQLPPLAGTNCLGADTYSLSPTFTINSGGTGYSTSSPPTISFVGGGGSGAAANAVVSATAAGLDSAKITAGGSGYTSAPTVSISNPGSGTGYALQAFVTGSPVTAVSLSTSNYCYPVNTGITPNPGITVSFGAPPPTAGGSAAVNNNSNLPMSSQACIYKASASAACGSGLKNDQFTLSYGGGFAGTATTDKSGNYSGGVTITNVGSYSSVPAGGGNVTVTGTDSKSKTCSFTVQFTGGVQIASLNLTSGGEYVSGPTPSLSGPVAVPAAPTVNATWTAGANNGKIGNVQITNAGTGFTSSSSCSYTLVFTGGGGSGAAGCADSSGGVVTALTGITLTNPGSGYLTAPTVVISGPGSGASATAYLTGGQRLMLGQVYTLTSLARTRNGSRAMAQAEIAVTPPNTFQLGGALTLAGASPSFGTPNSNVYKVNGTDGAASGGVEPATCNKTAGVALPAIGVYDSTAQSCVVSGSFTSGGVSQSCQAPNYPGTVTPLGKPNNYTGAQSAPDVQVEAAANPDPQQLVDLANSLYKQTGAVQLGPPIEGPGSCTPSNGTPGVNCGDFVQASVANWGSATNLQTIVVNGNLTLSGNPQGYGVLVVTGNVVFKGDFTWHGLVLVLGTATVDNSGGGNGSITGALYVAGVVKNADGTFSLGSSNFNWNGGGGNGIQYDHCWADDLIAKFPPVTNDQPLQVLSTRILQF